MTFEASKQAIAALLERIPVQPLGQGEILSQVKLADTASELAGVVAKTLRAAAGRPIPLGVG